MWARLSDVLLNKRNAGEVTVCDFWGYRKNMAFSSCFLALRSLAQGKPGHDVKLLKKCCWGVSWWLSRLRIQHCHCCGTGSIPCLGNFCMLWVWPKKKWILPPQSSLQIAAARAGILLKTHKRIQTRTTATSCSLWEIISDYYCFKHLGSGAICNAAIDN